MDPLNPINWTDDGEGITDTEEVSGSNPLSPTFGAFGPAVSYQLLLPTPEESPAAVPGSIFLAECSSDNDHTRIVKLTAKS